MQDEPFAARERADPLGSAGEEREQLLGLWRKDHPEPDLVVALDQIELEKRAAPLLGSHKSLEAPGRPRCRTETNGVTR